MKTWVRAIHLVMLVGGGFAGFVLTLQMILDGPQLDAVTASIGWLAELGLAYFVVAGVAVSQNDKYLPMAMAAYILQIPWLLSPIMTYRFAAGLALNVFVAGDNIGCTYFLGTQWYVGMARGDVWGFGLNWVAIAMVIVVACQWRAYSQEKAREAAALRQTQEADEPPGFQP